MLALGSHRRLLQDLGQDDICARHLLGDVHALRGCCHAQELPPLRCHFVNEGAQLTQGYRYLQYNNWGGKEKTVAQGVLEAAKTGAQNTEAKVKEAVGK